VEAEGEVFKATRWTSLKHVLHVVLDAKGHQGTEQPGKKYIFHCNVTDPGCRCCTHAAYLVLQPCQLSAVLPGHCPECTGKLACLDVDTTIGTANL
jgi:hypothetical protein